MKRMIVLALCLCLVAACAGAESALYPGFAWEELLEQPWEATLSAQARAVVPLDDARTEELNALLRHITLHLAWNPGEVIWGAVTARVDGEQVLRLEQWSGGGRTAVLVPGSGTALVSAGDPLGIILGEDALPDWDALPGWALTWLEDADRLVENLAGAEGSSGKKVNQSVQSAGTAVRQLTWKTGAGDGDVLWRTVVEACPEGALRDILSGLASGGKQSLVLLLDKKGDVLKVTYTGALKPREGEVRNVSLTWRRRRGETLFDKVTLKTPDKAGKVRNNLVFERSAKDTKKGRSLTVTFTWDDKTETDRDYVKGDVQLVAGEQLTGTVKLTRERSGTEKAKTALNLKPALSVTRSEGQTRLNGSLTWELKEDGHLSGGWTLRVDMRPLGEEVPAFPAETAELDGMSPEEVQAVNQQMLQTVTPGLIRALVLLPREDTLFLSRDLASWDEIVAAAQAAGE